MNIREMLEILNRFENATSNSSFYLYQNPLISEQQLAIAKEAKSQLVKFLVDLETKVVLTEEEYYDRLAEERARESEMISFHNLMR